MKLICLLIFVFPAAIAAQGTSCNNVIPQLVCPTDTVICYDETTDSMSLQNGLDLPDLEYFIIDQNIPAGGGSGPAIIGATKDPYFNPVDYGVDDTTTLDFIPVAFDVSSIQQVIDTVLNNQTLDGIPCCDLAIITDVCMGLDIAGIESGSDFTDLSQALVIFAEDSMDLLSIADLILVLDLLNILFADSTFYPASCGGGTVPQICYAYGEPCTFKVLRPENLLSIVPPAHQTDTLILADTIQSTALVQPSDTVIYNYRMEAQLNGGFEVQSGGTLEVARKKCSEQ